MQKDSVNMFYWIYNCNFLDVRVFSRSISLHDVAVRIQNRLPLFASNVFIPGQFRSCSELSS